MILRFMWSREKCLSPILALVTNRAKHKTRTIWSDCQPVPTEPFWGRRVGTSPALTDGVSWPEREAFRGQVYRWKVQRQPDDSALFKHLPRSWALNTALWWHKSLKDTKCQYGAELFSFSIPSIIWALDTAQGSGVQSEQTHEAATAASRKARHSVRTWQLANNVYLNRLTAPFHQAELQSHCCRHYNYPKDRAQRVLSVHHGQGGPVFHETR